MGLFDLIKKKLFGEKKAIEPKAEPEKKLVVIKEEKQKAVKDTQKTEFSAGLGNIPKDVEKTVEKEIVKKVKKKPEEVKKKEFVGKKKVEKSKEKSWVNVQQEEEVVEVEEEPEEEKIIEKEEIEEHKGVAREKEVKEEEILVEEKLETKQKTEEKPAEAQKELRPKRGLFQTLSTLFSHSAKQVVEQVVSKVTDRTIDEELFSDLFKDFELFLLEANVAFDVIDEFKERLRMRLLGKKVNRKQLEETLKETLRDELLVCFRTGDSRQIEQIIKETQKPFVILMIGINGSGKTTTIAKLAQRFLKNKLSVVFGAADTFRAAAQEQLEVHAERLKVPVIKQNYGADPAAVAFDAIAHAKAKGVDVVLVDSAGRLNTNENLIRELEKIKRVAKPSLTILVSEALSGADVLEQARVFCERVGIDFNIVTKLDATTKWGGLISIAHQTKKPIMFVGMGQEYEDLEVFEKGKFIDELLGGI